MHEAEADEYVLAPEFYFLSSSSTGGEGRRLFSSLHPSILLFRLSRISLFDLARQILQMG